jgi:hypothetical protein
MSEQRVTPEQAAVFAAYDEQDSKTVWYNADPSLLARADQEESPYDATEMDWLRDLALDHADLTAALAACEADYADIVRTLREVQNRHWDEYRTELAKNALSTPRAVAVLKEGR